MEKKPSMGRIVIYNHPGSADGKYPPMQSPAVIQKVMYSDLGNTNPETEHVLEETCDLFVMSNTNGTFFAKNIKQGDGPSQWNWPEIV